MERYIARVANGLDRKRFRASIICLQESGEAISWIEKDDVEVVELGRSGNNFSTIRHLARALKSLKVDIVNSHNWATLLESHLGCRMAGGLIHAHAERGTVLGPTSKNRWRNRARALMMRWVISRADCTVTNADAVARKIHKLTGLINHPITVIPNGLDAPYSESEMSALRTRTRNELGIPAASSLVGSVGRLVPVKNFGLAIRALQSLEQQTAHLVLVGDGPCRQELKEFAAQCGVADRTHLVGNQSNVWPYLAAMDVYVNTSDSEGMSQSILEAMASGLPVVATDVGDSRKLVCGEEQCGFIADVGSESAFTSCLVEGLSNSETMSRLASNARTVHTRLYSLRAMLTAFETFYFKLWLERAHGRRNCPKDHADRDW